MRHDCTRCGGKGVVMTMVSSVGEGFSAQRQVPCPACETGSAGAPPAPRQDAREALDVDLEIGKLERRILALEARVKALEPPPPPCPACGGARTVSLNGKAYPCPEACEGG